MLVAGKSVGGQPAAFSILRIVDLQAAPDRIAFCRQTPAGHHSGFFIIPGVFEPALPGGGFILLESLRGLLLAPLTGKVNRVNFFLCHIQSAKQIIFRMWIMNSFTVRLCLPDIVCCQNTFFMHNILMSILFDLNTQAYLPVINVFFDQVFTRTVAL